MQTVPIVHEAVKILCDKFESGGYSLTPIIDLGALVANADGVVDEDEIKALRYLLDALLGTQLDSDMVQWLVRSSLRVILEAGLEPRARLISEILLDCEAAEAGLIVALGVAFASGGLSAPERHVIELIAHQARVPQKRLLQLIDRVQQSTRSSSGADA